MGIRYAIREFENYGLKLPLPLAVFDSLDELKSEVDRIMTLYKCRNCFSEDLNSSNVAVEYAPHGQSWAVYTAAAMPPSFQFGTSSGHVTCNDCGWTARGSLPFP